MKRTGSILFLLSCMHFCFGQRMDLKDFSNLLDMSPIKLESHIQKKGYRLVTGNEASFSYYLRENKKEKCTTGFQLPREQDAFAFTYQTTSRDEFNEFRNEILAGGFTYPQYPRDSTAILYQRLDTRIKCSRQIIDSTEYYLISIGKKNLPKRKDILSAEDLLQLDAQQYLIDVFGKENIRTDLFYFTEKETNRCTVLFPGTDREAIFVWNDEENLKDISFIVFGGSIRPKATMTTTAVAQNVWTTRQGVRCGMGLQEVQQLNKQPVQFYNWKTESAGYLAPENKGDLNFKQLGIVFNCLNCGYIQVADEPIIDSQSALLQDQKVYVVSYVVLPEKKMVPSLSHR